MSDLTVTTRWELTNSQHHPKTTIPCFGFGVYNLAHDSSIITALNLGYRQLDTAQMYGNEASVGHAVATCGIPRSELFIVTKIEHPKNGLKQTLDSCRESVLKSTGSKKGKWEGGEGYVDLFLIHTPTCGPLGRRILWEALEMLRLEGGTREIGVSNYGVKHLEELFTYASFHPVVNQLELHPFCPQPKVASFCADHNILLQAFSPLIRATKMSDPTLVSVAQAHKVTIAQVLLRWNLQKGWIPIPKSDNPERIRLNKELFDWSLTAEEMKEIEKLGVGMEDGQGAVCPYLAHVP